nr:hypothetical protein [Candidatus Sigynarchaeota archaeon]
MKKPSIGRSRVVHSREERKTPAQKAYDAKETRESRKTFAQRNRDARP